MEYFNETIISCAMQGESVPTGEDPSFCEPLTLEQKTSTIGGASGKVSLWMQWMLPKLTVKLYAPDPTTKTGKAILSPAKGASLNINYAGSAVLVSIGLAVAHYLKCFFFFLF